MTTTLNRCAFIQSHYELECNLDCEDCNFWVAECTCNPRTDVVVCELCKRYLDNKYKGAIPIEGE